VRDVAHQVTHAVVAVRYQNGWLILDNRTLFMVSADESPYQYLFALDHRGACTFATEVARRGAVQTRVSVSYF
jgi:predicted transglutaminase-like cysteine proteinase